MVKQESDCLTISIQEAARLLSISRGLAYEMVRQKKIPSLKFGRVIRIPKHGLELLLAGQDIDTDSKQTDTQRRQSVQ